MKGMTALALAMVTLLATCEDEALTARIVTDPANGSENVRTDSDIVLSFNRPVTGYAVENGFHLLPNTTMLVVMDSMLAEVAGAGNMNHQDSLQIYERMLGRMKTQGMGGLFTWNSDSTRCVFDPDSMMGPNTVYAIHMGKDMMTAIGMNHGEGMISGEDHGMMGEAAGMMHGDMVRYFTTGGPIYGHEAHHN